MKIIFMGTPNFAAHILEKLLEEHIISLVITQPDRLGSRKSINYSPVKSLALKHNLNIIQPQKIGDAIDIILSSPCDLIVSAAYGQFVPMKILNYPPYRSINVHASLLPQYRGGAPIQRALMNGDTKTGISIIYMEKKMDAGDILAQESLAIEAEDNSDSLFIKLAQLGASLVLETIKNLKQGNITLKRQNKEEVSFAYNLSKEDEFLDFSSPAKKLVNQIRALASNPGAYFKIDNEIYKVYEATSLRQARSIPPATIIEVGKDYFTISCAQQSAIKFTKIKPAGRPLMEVRDFLNGKGKNIIIKNRRIQ